MKKDVARFVDKHGLDRELIEVKLSSSMTWALVSVKEWDRCTANADCRLADKQVKWRQMSPKYFFCMDSGIPRTDGICVMACLYATSITSSSLVVSDNCRVKTCSPRYVSQCNLWLSGFAGHIIIKTRKNPEDLTEVRVLTAFQRIAKQKLFTWSVNFLAVQTCLTIILKLPFAYRIRVSPRCKVREEVWWKIILAPAVSV